MTQLSQYFKREEFACKDGCGACNIEPELIGVLEDIRQYFGRPVIIVSGYRCESHNRNVGGASNSQHLLGAASDFNIKNVSLKAIADYLELKYPNKYGIGRYKTFIHIDVRNYKARWGHN
ncbi:D-Ala-D-Ala carboxypeptidase family metallohydrolase [Providencia rettgeri]|uniref:D-Ala-D-Ala carboxypeptidase family metallohydrolase n=1 Tax=Providencia rettgeri TaxID=587 RepID=UPI002940EFC0|nr:DUF882 domain-containing protein [Providencia rettgeri]ELR5166291.1 DUF882 domain-containing protein [Providencia rettgeri]ELR5245710.1 DUF882 domain-containing protein [Providencia rettgeri]